LLTDVAPASAEKPKAISAADADVVMSTPAPGVREVEETARPEQAAVEPQIPEVQEAAPSKPTQPLVSAGKPVPTKVAAKPRGRPDKPVTFSPATSAQVNARQGWQRVAGAGVVVLVLAGALAWWFSHRSSDAASDSRIDATAGVTAPAPIPAPAAPVLRAPPAAGAVPTVILPQEETHPKTPSVSEAPNAAAPPKVEATTVVPAVVPAAVTRTDTAPFPKPKPRATPKPAPKAEQKTDWQDQANDDIDAWAEKIK
jgi:hypothetical protein